MKKLALCFMILIVITGCNNQDDKIDINFDGDYYQNYIPYKPSMVGSYVVGNELNNYNPINIENDLMTISANYYKLNNSYYQNGQYLTKEDLEKLLSDNMLNKFDEIEVDGVKIKPALITSIHEQNYLASNGNLKGISLAITVNPYQVYKNNYGTNSYKVMENEYLILEVNKRVEELIKFLRSKGELHDKRIVIGIYHQSAPNSILPGSFKYIGSTFDNNIKLEKIDYNYYHLDDDYIIKNNTDIYNLYTNLISKIKEVNSTINVRGIVVSYNREIRKVEIEVLNSAFSKSELLYLSKIISEDITSSFKSNIYIKVVIKNNSSVDALIIKKSDILKSEIYILK